MIARFQTGEKHLNLDVGEVLQHSREPRFLPLNVPEAVAVAGQGGGLHAGGKRRHDRTVKEKISQTKKQEKRRTLFFTSFSLILKSQD